MQEKFKILIADRNPHVRELLRREMTAEGYLVRLAENGHEVLKWAFKRDRFDLVILDPDLPDADELPILKKLQNRVPVLPVIVHAFLSIYDKPSETDGSFFVEKRGSSIENLKKAVYSILKGDAGKSDDSV